MADEEDSVTTLNPLHGGQGGTPTRAAVPVELEVEAPTPGQPDDAASLWKRVVAAAQIARQKTFPFMTPEGKLPLTTKLVYAMPQFSLTSLTLLIGIHGTLFFNKIGADVSFIAFFTAFARSFDVMTDPVMGWWSDKTVHKMGRRRPYMWYGMWWYGIIFFLLFSPPASLGSTGVGLWFGLMYILFYAADTVANVPYSALGPELSDDSGERDSLFFWAKFINGIGILIAAVGPVMLGVAFRDCACDPICPQGQAQAAALNVTWDPSWGSLPDGNYTESACPSSGDFTGLCCGLNNWCQCREDCDGDCDVDASRKAMMTVAALFGAIYIGSMALCVGALRERQPNSTASTEAAPLVPSLIGTLRNKPFMGLLPAWIMDMAAYTMLGTMLPFFVEECDDGKRAAFGLDSDGQDPSKEDEAWCKADIWLGFGLVMLIGAQIMFMPMWLCLTRKLGKFRTWLLFNLFNSVTNALFVFASTGDPKMTIVFAVINGIPAGAQFLTDSIVADTIAYDEFLTGFRSEGRFTIFATFIPKIVSIPAQAIPLALLAFVGFKPPENGVPQPQPDSVKTFIRLVFFVIPSILSIGSFFIKRKFPIQTEHHLAQINEGIAIHAQGLPAVDPLTGRTVTLFKASKSELKSTFDLDNFFPRQLRRMAQPGGFTQVAAEVKRTMQYCVGGALFCFVTCTVSISVGALTNEKVSWLPAFSIIGFGMLIAGALFNRMRYKTALRLVSTPPDMELLRRWTNHVTGVSDGFEDNTSMAKQAVILEEKTRVTRGGRRVSVIELSRVSSRAIVGRTGLHQRSIPEGKASAGIL